MTHGGVIDTSQDAGYSYVQYDVGTLMEEGSMRDWQRRWSRMESDSATIVGTSHSRNAEPSQDCAVHGATDLVGWGIVSDGCSSGGRTDFGARLWAMALEDDLSKKDGELVRAVMAGAPMGECLAKLAPRPERGLEWVDLLATAVVVFATHESAWAVISGDGMAVAVYADGSLDVVEHRYSDNTPFYPQYLCVDAGMRSFVSKSRSMGQLMTVERTKLSEDGAVVERCSTVVPIDGSMEFIGSSYLLPNHGPGTRESPLMAILAVSDGVGSRPKGSLTQTVQEVCAVKSWRGPFLRRRLSALAKAWLREQAMPKDDLSVSGLCWPSDGAWQP